MAEGEEHSKKAEDGQKNIKPSPTLTGTTSQGTPRNGSPHGSSKLTHEEDAHEQSPLLSPTGMDNEEEEGLMGDGVLDSHRDDFTETKNLWYMILLTISIGGLQLAWAVELSNGTPYLLSLGLSKSLMALVWIAGPLSGALVQPYIGILSDNCRSTWGKRTPFMIVGGIATVFSLLALAWIKEIVGGFLGIFGANPESNGVKNTVIFFAVVFIYVLDFSINTGMSNWAD